MTKKTSKPKKEVREDSPQKWNKDWDAFIKKNPPKTNKAKK